MILFVKTLAELYIWGLQGLYRFLSSSEQRVDPRINPHFPSPHKSSSGAGCMSAAAPFSLLGEARSLWFFAGASPRPALCVHVGA